MTGLDMVLAALEAAADAPVVEYRGRSHGGHALLARVRARAQDLAAQGIGPDRTVLILVTDNLSAMEQMLACWTLGAAGCFVDGQSPPERVAEWMERLSPALCLGVRLKAGVQAHLQPRDPVPVADGALRPPGDEAVRAARLASIASTSGTTGQPKIQRHSQGRLGDILRSLPIRTGGGAMLSATSLAYSASYLGWLRSLAGGRRIVAMDFAYRLEELDAALRRADVEECNLPPPVIRRLAALAGPTPRYPQLIQLGSVGGPALPEDKLAAVTRLSPRYEMSYSCVGIGLVSRITGAEVLDRPASCGKPVAGVSVTIRDGSRICATGETGEICVTTATIPEVRPGDLGRVDEDGYLFIVGRVQGLLCRKGVNVSAERLVEVALQRPEVAQAAVVAFPDSDGGDEIHLAVQCPEAEAPAVIDHVRRTLPPAERPDHVHVRSLLPLTPAAKVDMRRLRAELSALREDAHAG